MVQPIARIAEIRGAERSSPAGDRYAHWYQGRYCCGSSPSRRYALSLIQVSVAADDLVQDCLERGISRIHLFQSGTNLRA